MIRVTRLAEPAVLGEKKAEWQAKYDARRAKTPKARPESKQYAHPSVVETLAAMSHGKCFYCEGQGKLTVDHYIEVAERGDLAFRWDNLYLACDGCQTKIPNTSLPAADCVDPCDPATDPSDHLDFQAEYITFRTPRGEATIKKYRLKRDLLVSERRRMLREFDAELRRISETKGWRDMSSSERQALLRYGQSDSPFSLMFKALLSDLRISGPPDLRISGPPISEGRRGEVTDGGPTGRHAGE